MKEMSKKCKERLLGPENGYTEGLKKFGEEDVIMKHNLRVSVSRKFPKLMRNGSFEQFKIFK